MAKPGSAKGAKPVVKSSKTWGPDSAIGFALRKTYRDVAEEPIPEDLKRLLEMLRKKETGS